MNFSLVRVSLFVCVHSIYKYPTHYSLSTDKEDDNDENDEYDKRLKTTITTFHPMSLRRVFFCSLMLFKGVWYISVCVYVYSLYSLVNIVSYTSSLL